MNQRASRTRPLGRVLLAASALVLGLAGCDSKPAPVNRCAMLAQRYGLACSTEIEFLREVLPDATIDRVAHKLGGAHVCSYEIRRRAVNHGQPVRAG